jgi:hypothetical protein
MVDDGALARGADRSKRTGQPLGPNTPVHSSNGRD